MSHGVSKFELPFSKYYRTQWPKQSHFRVSTSRRNHGGDPARTRMALWIISTTAIGPEPSLSARTLLSGRLFTAVDWLYYLWLLHYHGRSTSTAHLLPRHFPAGPATTACAYLSTRLRAFKFTFEPLVTAGRKSRVCFRSGENGAPTDGAESEKISFLILSEQKRF